MLHKYRSSSIAELMQRYYRTSSEQFQVDPVMISLTGRIVDSRLMARVASFHLEDRTGSIQLYLKKDEIENFEEIKSKMLDASVSIKGQLFSSVTGLISVLVHEIAITNPTCSFLEPPLQ